MLESPHPREVPFFVDSTATSKTDLVSVLPEKERALSEASQPDEKQPAESDQKPNSSEQSTDRSPTKVAPAPAKPDEKAKPVVLNPVPHQQVKQPPEDKPMSVINENECKDSDSAVLSSKTVTDVSKETDAKQVHSMAPQPAYTENNMQTKGVERSQSLVDSVVLVVPPSENTKRRFTVKKVEDPVLNSISSSEVKPENKDTEPPLAANTNSNADISSETKVVPNNSNKDNLAQAESEPKQELSGEVELPRNESMSPSQQVIEDANTVGLGDSDILKPQAEPSAPSLPDKERLQISFEVGASKTGGEPLKLESTNSSRPQTPTYAFHPVDNSVSDERAVPHNFKFESQLSGEELDVDKPKPESLASSDDELMTSAPTGKSGSDFVQGRFTVSVSSGRPETPLTENSEQVKPPAQPVEITLQDVTGAVGSDSVPSLTPSSSVESLNSVGSQPGVQNTHAFSSSPQTILPDGQSSTNLSTVSNKEQARKNSGQSDLLNDSAKLMKQEGDQGRQTGEQVFKLRDHT